MRIALLAPAPDYPEEWDWAFEPQSRPLIEAGADVEAVRWTEAADLSAFDLVLPLIAWGYHLRYAEWLAFLDRVEGDRIPMVNPPKLLRCNSDKMYLTQLPEQGVATVPSIIAANCTSSDLDRARHKFACDDIVVKPLISSGAWGTYRLAFDDPLPSELRDHSVIVQPMVHSVTEKGEYSLILFDGVLSHAVVKRPKKGDFRVQLHLGGSAVRCSPPPGGEALAKAALKAAPAHATYARIDMVEAADGELMVMEMELVEPALFLAQAPEGTDAFVNAVFSAAQRACE